MKKIMFNDKYGLTQAVLDGRKTQTRRFVPNNIVEGYHDLQIMDKEWEEKGLATSGFMSFEDFCLYEMLFQKQCYKIGEEVAVAQSYESINDDIDWVTTMIRRTQAGWKNKMFVRAEDMPHRIRIKGIRVERLQDISEEDCLKEGVRLSYLGRLKRNYLLYNMEKSFLGPKRAFACLINLICGKSTWKRNPYVFVYDFELVK